MRMTRYFFSVYYLPEDSDYPLLAGRCISTLHGYTSHHPDTRIGVSFPDWTDTTLGRTIAFVSVNRSHLEQLKERAYFKILKEEKIFSISPVLKVPEYCPDVMFIRNQAIAKCFVKERKRRLERAKRRAEARGEVFQPRVNSPLRSIEAFHGIFMQSISNGCSFLLHIQKKEARIQSNHMYCSYGLASNEVYTGHVPDLSSVVKKLF